MERDEQVFAAEMARVQGNHEKAKRIWDSITAQDYRDMVSSKGEAYMYQWANERVTGALKADGYTVTHDEDGTWVKKENA